VKNRNTSQPCHKKAGKRADETAFGRLYEEYWERLFKQIVRILPDEDEAADIVQQAFVDLWAIRERIPQIKSVKSFLFIMARNLAFKRLRENLKSEHYRDEYAAHYPSSVPATEQDFDFRELNRLLENHTAKLPAKMREVFLLSRESGLSYLEIAQRLNISDKTVKKQISNALKILKLKIGREYAPYLEVLLVADVLFG